MEVMLLQDVKDLGTMGQVVRVADGYARNYLLPRNLAAPVTEATRRRLAKLQKEREEAERKRLEEARRTAAEIARISNEGLLTIAARAGAGDPIALYGSVTAADIAAVLKQNGFEVEKNQILLLEPIKELGAYEVPIKLHPQVEVVTKIWVVEEK
jgi:large subunit ribosomal protein L9